MENILAIFPYNSACALSKLPKLWLVSVVRFTLCNWVTTIIFSLAIARNGQSKFCCAENAVISFERISPEPVLIQCTVFAHFQPTNSVFQVRGPNHRCQSPFLFLAFCVKSNDWTISTTFAIDFKIERSRISDNVDINKITNHRTQGIQRWVLYNFVRCQSRRH